jgi:hypothetical protein
MESSEDCTEVFTEVGDLKKGIGVLNQMNKHGNVIVK